MKDPILDKKCSHNVPMGKGIFSGKSGGTRLARLSRERRESCLPDPIVIPEAILAKNGYFNGHQGEGGSRFPRAQVGPFFVETDRYVVVRIGLNSPSVQF